PQRHRDTEKTTREDSKKGSKGRAGIDHSSVPLCSTLSLIFFSTFLVFSVSLCLCGSTSFLPNSFTSTNAEGLSRAPDPRPTVRAHAPPLAATRRVGGLRPVTARTAAGGRRGPAQPRPLVHSVPAPRRAQPARRLGHEA